MCIRTGTMYRYLLVPIVHSFCLNVVLSRGFGLINLVAIHRNRVPDGIGA